MTKHANANHVFIIGEVIQTWTYSDDRICRVSMQRASFQVSDRTHDLVNVIIPGALKRGIEIKKGDVLHVSGFIQSEDRDVLLSKLTKAKLPDDLKKLKVRQIVTQVRATNWQLVV